MNKHKSRKITPWDGEIELTPTQEFLKQRYEDHYAERHITIRDSNEAKLINSYVPGKCPFCGSDKFKKRGHTSDEVQRYKRICGKTFLPTTGTIFDEHRISISEWMEYCLNVFCQVSITADSWNNKKHFYDIKPLLAQWLQVFAKSLYLSQTVLCNVVILDFQKPSSLFLLSFQVVHGEGSARK